MEADLVIPSIKVAVSESFNEPSVLKEVLSGIEEEAVPYEISYLPGDDAVALAYHASEMSILEVGIGLDGRGNLAVHYHKLPSNSPLFLLNYKHEKERLRSMCSNGARLTKGTPFIL